MGVQVDLGQGEERGHQTGQGKRTHRAHRKVYKEDKRPGHKEDLKPGSQDRTGQAECSKCLESKGGGGGRWWRAPRLQTTGGRRRSTLDISRRRRGRGKGRRKLKCSFRHPPLPERSLRSLPMKIRV